MSYLKKNSVNKKPDTKLEEVEEIVGTIDYIRFHSPKSGYCVLSIKRDNAPDATAVGYMSSPQENSQYKFKGEYIKHKKYGWQFKFQEFELHLPENKTGITRYLASVMYGVGPVRAKAIVDELGEDALKIIKDDSSVLEQFDFIEQKQIDQIHKDLTENSLQAEFKSSICRQGISPRMAMKIWTTYMVKDKNPKEVLEMVQDNPYQLIDNVTGIGFKIADKIARGLGVDKDSPFRLKAAIKHVLKDATSRGHVYLPFKKTLKQAREVLEIHLDWEEVGRMVKKMADDQNELKREDNDVYLKNYHKDEKRLAGQLRILLNSDEFKEYNIEGPLLEEKIQKEEELQDIAYAEEQKAAIERALQNNISIITGGPGTGKTTVINSICNIYYREYPNNVIHQASPTGKAAKRMEEATGREAKTIHLLLKYNPFIGGFSHGFDNQLPGPGLMIIDEFSMCDLQLAKDLFSAVDTDLKVVLVGDVDQLPSVGAGSVLRDMIASKKVPVTRLKFNYRQADGSIVAKMANEIADSQVPELKSIGDFAMRKVFDNEEGEKQVLNLVKTLQEKDIDIMDLQILSPMRKGDTGVNNLNENIRDIVNHLPDNEEKAEEMQLGKFRLGDKVMVIKNDYDKMVFNGNIGKVVKVESNKLFVDIIDNNSKETVEFGITELDLLTLAYATTIHKSQGSEFRVVIMVLTKNHYVMLRRNLLYTGMTRAKDKLVLVADPWAVKKAIRNNKVETRYSKLAERMRE